MSMPTKYWARVFGVGTIAIGLNVLLDKMFDVQIGSGRDWLIYFALLLPGMYFFVYKWSEKVGFPKGNKL